MQVIGQQIRVSDVVVSAELGDEAVLLNVETGLYFGLGEAELLIWQLISDGVTEANIIARLHDEYDVDAEQLQSDVNAFLITLEERGLIERISET